MNSYRVKWEIDVEADTPEEAARKALAIQRNPESIATVFDVEEPGRLTYARIDLTPGAGGERVRFACKYCGSESVCADAAARWDFDRQEWVITTVFDKGHSCDDCDGETSIVEVAS